MYKLICSIIVLGSLTGCATHQQANTAVGAGVGAVVGHAIGGHGGAIAGAVVGSAIGSNQPASPPVAYSPRPIYTPYPVRPNCYSTIYIDQFGNKVRRTTCR